MYVLEKKKKWQGVKTLKDHTLNRNILIRDRAGTIEFTNIADA